MITISLESVSHTESKHMCIISMCSDLTEKKCHFRRKLRAKPASQTAIKLCVVFRLDFHYLHTI